MNYLANAVALSMIPDGVSVRVTTITDDDARLWARTPWVWRSIVGHESTAELFSLLLGQIVAHDRVTVILAPGDTVLVGQYNGPRLPEGVTCLPEGATVTWRLVEVDAISQYHCDTCANSLGEFCHEAR